MNNAWGEDTIVYTNEYGKAGMAIDSDDWMPFCATITIPNNFSNSNSYRNNIYLGFPDKTAEGASFYIDSSEKDSVYFAQEQPFDIKLHASESVLINKTSVRLDAEVVNQLGLKGALSQDFDWYALKNDGSTEESGITFDGSGASVIASWSEGLEKGEYIIAAKSKNI